MIPIRPVESPSYRRAAAVIAMAAGSVLGLIPPATAVELAGIVVTPHEPSIATEMRYWKLRGPTDGARVQLVLRHDGPGDLTLADDTVITVGGTSPDKLVASGAWAWHDFPSEWPDEPLTLPVGSLTVLSFNAAGGGWGVGTAADLAIPGQPAVTLAIEPPDAWLSAVTFLRRDAAEGIESMHPDTLVVHVENAADVAWTLDGVRLWTPRPGDSHRVLVAGPWLEGWTAFQGRAAIGPRDSGGLVVPVEKLPLSYAAVEVRLRRDDSTTRSLWGHVRVKCEHFVIGGGWVNSKLPSGQALHAADYLRTLKRMHIDCGNHGLVPGYTDDPERWTLCPLKMMSACRPFEDYDTDALLPRIHAVEFLGEPQYGGGRPVPPAEVWRKLAPYQRTRMPTSLTHSEERIWRLYAGLSDHPHFDAYRVCAPAADTWRRYDRWGRGIGWGAPLETIGDLTRSLRELSRPSPIAAWSQGPHQGWDSTAGRLRTSPTPDELVVQAWHALAARITSLYWFNLSVPSVVKFRDLIEPITRVDREALVLAPLMLEGAAGRHVRLRRQDGAADWDLSTICGPDAAILVAIDLDYRPDPERKEFVFQAPRQASWRFPLPGYLAGIRDVFRIDADGVHVATWRQEEGDVVIDARADRVAVHVATPDPALRGRLEASRRRLVESEAATEFDPARDDAHFARLAALLEKPAEPAGSSSAAAGRPSGERSPTR